MSWYKCLKKMPSVNILSGTSVPLSNQGSDGQIYLRYAELGALYTFKEYIEVGSTAGAYIDTGYTFTSDDEFEFKAAYTATPGNGTYAFGSWTSGKDTLIGYTGNRIAYSVGDRYYNFNFDTNDHIYKATQSSMLLDGVATGVSPNWNSVDGSTVGMFKVSTLNATNNFRIYYCKVWTNGDLSKYYIPVVRNSDGKIGVLELISNTFLTNAGSQSFSVSSSSIPAPITQKPIINAYAKVNGAWQDLIFTDVDDIIL